MYPTNLTVTHWQFIEKTLDLGYRKYKHIFTINLECYQLPSKEWLSMANAAL